VVCIASETISKPFHWRLSLILSTVYKRLYGTILGNGSNNEPPLQEGPHAIQSNDHTHTHTHTHMSVCVCVCVPWSQLFLYVVLPAVEVHSFDPLPGIMTMTQTRTRNTYAYIYIFSGSTPVTRPWDNGSSKLVVTKWRTGADSRLGSYISFRSGTLQASYPVVTDMYFLGSKETKVWGR